MSEPVKAQAARKRVTENRARRVRETIMLGEDLGGASRESGVIAALSSWTSIAPLG
jgi:hypothetical protein